MAARLYAGTAPGGGSAPYIGGPHVGEFGEVCKGPDRHGMQGGNYSGGTSDVCGQRHPLYKGRKGATRSSGGRPAPTRMKGLVGDQFERLRASSLGPIVVACRAATTQVEQVMSGVNVTHFTENLYSEVKLSSVNLRVQLNSANTSPVSLELKVLQKTPIPKSMTLTSY